ncbi:hypothetical protein QR680_013295 [Steinernema hermaphroditum]|uniref:Uncharacterized protein n=1 Tax=Steinernema hermaphroditum TaxID=289476 RepID=A0AA39I513_9BILA|nr:hypothetical protein QR680_013295 [Steinernema hermaphroditum]
MGRQLLRFKESHSLAMTGSGLFDPSFVGVTTKSRETFLTFKNRRVVLCLLTVTEIDLFVRLFARRDSIPGSGRGPTFGLVESPEVSEVFWREASTWHSWDAEARGKTCADPASPRIPRNDVVTSSEMAPQGLISSDIHVLTHGHHARV